MARLPWSPSDIMHTPLPLVRLALEGVEERDHHGFTMLFASQGLKLEPLPRLRPKQTVSAAAILAWKDAVNARVAANKAAAGQAKTLRPGGGAPPRPSRRTPRIKRPPA